MIPCLECPGVEERVPIRSVVGSVAFEEEVQVEIVIEGLRVFLDPLPEGIPNSPHLGLQGNTFLQRLNFPRGRVTC